MAAAQCTLVTFVSDLIPTRLENRVHKVKGNLTRSRRPQFLEPGAALKLLLQDPKHDGKRQTTELISS